MLNTYLIPRLPTPEPSMTQTMTSVVKKPLFKLKNRKQLSQNLEIDETRAMIKKVQKLKKYFKKNLKTIDEERQDNDHQLKPSIDSLDNSLELAKFYECTTHKKMNTQE
jgi:hypothetical protein